MEAGNYFDPFDITSIFIKRDADDHGTVDASLLGLIERVTNLDIHVRLYDLRRLKGQLDLFL
jgi:hypothetical protein